MRKFLRFVLVAAVLGLLAAAVIPNLVRARVTRSLNSCIDVHQPAIAQAKERWARDHNRPVGALPTREDLLPYLEGRHWPECPAGGTYEIGPVGTLPGCSKREIHPWGGRESVRAR